MGCKYDSLNNIFIEDSELISVLPHVVWHITSECLLNCKFCFDEKLSTSCNHQINIREIISILKKLGVQKIDISGGEPLLSDLLQEIVKECIRHDIYFTLTTSGFVDERIDNTNWLIKNWKLFSRVILSLDGLESKHNFLRGNAETFNAFSSLYSKLLIEKCDILRINTVITRHLIMEENRKLFLQYITKLKPLEWCLIKPYPLNQRWSYNSLDITMCEFEDFRKCCAPDLKEAKIKLIHRNNDYYSGYWRINSAGKMKQISRIEGCSAEIDLLKTDIEEIRQLIDKNGLKLPEDRRL